MTALVSPRPRLLFRLLSITPQILLLSASGPPYIVLPAVAVNLVLLQNNKVLSSFKNGSTATVWEYVNNSFTSVPDSADLFCSGHALLADGRVI